MNYNKFPDNEQKQQNWQPYNIENKAFLSEQQEQVFLRQDVNQLFDKMMVDADFNLKKYNKARYDKSKQFKKPQNIEHYLQNQKSLRNTTEPFDSTTQYQSYKFQKRKIPTQKQQQNHQNNLYRKPLLKTENLNKLLRRKDAINVHVNQKRSFDGSKTTNNFNQVSSKLSNSKNQQKQSLFQSTKYIELSSANKPNNLRRKVMSLTTKGNNHRFQTQNLNQSKNITLNLQKQVKNVIKGKLKTSQQNLRQFKQGNDGKSKNKYNELQKKYNKGGRLKFKHVQNWLNNIIQEYCHDQYFDSSLTSAALKKYYIDSNSLMSNGVDPNDVNRIYNSLFVYSIGFNNLIKQISKGNKQLVKNIWKVFSLLLQYCAAGNYETVIGEIQRDKLRKVEELKVQIERRQQVIQKNQEINEQKNMTMYKQLKRLKDQNINLSNQRQILMEDFQQADQAFNQQVSLRLKFQNTINQIYGIHKQLSNKHGRLFYDFQLKIQQLRKSSQKYFQQTKTHQKTKYELIELKQKYDELNKVNSHDKQHIDVLLIQLSKMKQNYFQTLKQLEKAKNLSSEKQRKLQQIEIQLKNNKVILQLRQKSAKQTHTQYRITLQQNNKLFMVISEQRQQMEVLLKQKKQFNQNVLKILADASYYKKKSQGTQSTIKQLKQKVVQYQIALHKSQVQNQINIKDGEALKRDLQSNYQNIKKMHQKNFQLEQELQFLRKYQGNMDQVLEQKNNLITVLKDKIDDLDKRLNQEIHDFRNLESKYKILQTQFRAQKQSTFRRFQQFKKEQEQMTTNQSSLSKLLNTTHVELERYKTLFNNTLMDYKNEKFERGNLILNYEQILKVMQKKNAQQKQQAIKINELQQQVNQYKQKYKLTHLALVNTTEQLTNKINNLKITVSDQKQLINKKAHHYHPMLYEDLIHKYQREIQNHQNTKILLSQQRKKLNSQRFQNSKQVKILKSDHEYQIEKMEKNHQKLEQKLKQQIQYLKQSNTKIQQRLSSLQMLEATYKQKVVFFQQKQNQQQQRQRLVKQIQDKKQKINQLYQQIQKIHDLKRDQIVNLQKRIKQAQDEKMNFIYEFKTKKERQMREQLEKQYKQQMQKFKQEYQKPLSSHRLGISPQMLKSRSSRNITPQEHRKIEQYQRQIIMNKPLDQILGIKKQQFQSLGQLQNKNFFDQIQAFFKRQASKGNHQLFNRTNYFTSSKGSTQKDFSKSKNEKVPNYLQKIQNSSQDLKKRNSISRKLKNAFEYYGKQTRLPK